MTVQYYSVLSQKSGLALDLDGTRVTIAERVNRKESQMWYDDRATGTIRNKSNKLCLDFENGEIVVALFVKQNNHQKWLRNGNVISNRQKVDEVIDIDGSDQKPGAKLVARSSSVAKNHEWSFEDGPLETPKEEEPAVGKIPEAGKPDEKHSAVKPPVDEKTAEKPPGDEKTAVKPPGDEKTAEKPPGDEKTAEKPPGDEKTAPAIPPEKMDDKDPGSGDPKKSPESEVTEPPAKEQPVKEEAPKPTPLPEPPKPPPPPPPPPVEEVPVAPPAKEDPVIPTPRGVIDELGEMVPLLKPSTSSSSSDKKRKPIFTPKRVAIGFIGLLTLAAVAVAVGSLLKDGPPQQMSDLVSILKIANISNVLSAATEIGSKVLDITNQTSLNRGAVESLGSSLQGVIDGSKGNSTIDLASILKSANISNVLSAATEIGSKVLGITNQTDVGVK